MTEDASPPPFGSRASDLAGSISATLDPLGRQSAVAARRMGSGRHLAAGGAKEAASSDGPREESRERQVIVPAPAGAVELRAELPLPAGALAHLPVVVELLRRVDIGQFALAERMEATQGELTLGDLGARAVAEGDAVAADALLDLVGMGEVNETLSRINLKQTHLVRGFVDRGDEPAWRANRTSAHDMLTLLGLARGAALPGAEWLRARLAGQRHFPELAAALPEEAELAHLPAIGAELTHDAGMLRGPGGACAYCVLVAGAADAGAARAAVVAVVRLLWEAWCAG